MRKGSTSAEIHAPETPVTKENAEFFPNIEQGSINEFWGKTRDALTRLKDEGLISEDEIEGALSLEVHLMHAITQEDLSHLGSNPEQDSAFQSYGQGWREILSVIHFTAEDALEEKNKDKASAVSRMSAYLGVERGAPMPRFIEEEGSEEEATSLEGIQRIMCKSYGEFAREYNDELNASRTEALHRLIKEIAPYEEGKRPWETNPGIERDLSELEPANQEAPPPEKLSEENVEGFQPQTEQVYRQRLMRAFSNWDERVQRDGGRILNTQGRTPEGAEQRDRTGRILGVFKTNKKVEAKQEFYMNKMPVRIPASLTRSGNEELVDVKVSEAVFSEVTSVSQSMGLLPGEGASGERYYSQFIYSVDATANSLVKAQESLWQLEAAKLEDGYYMVPVVQKIFNKNTREWEETACWLPLEQDQYDKWKKDLQSTVRNFKRAFKDRDKAYENLKNLQAREVFEERQIKAQQVETSPEEEGSIRVPNPIGEVENDPYRVWYNSHLQLAGLEEAIEALDAGSLSEEDQEALAFIQESWANFYAEFLAVYGRGSEYHRIAREILARTNIDLTTDEGKEMLNEEILRVVREYDLRKVSLLNMVSASMETLDYLRHHPDEIPDKLKTLRELIAHYESRISVEASVGEGASEEEVSSIVDVEELSEESTPEAKESTLEEINTIIGTASPPNKGKELEASEQEESVDGTPVHSEGAAIVNPFGEALRNALEEAGVQTAEEEEPQISEEPPTEDQT